jgi:hypothetical protein
MTATQRAVKLSIAMCTLVAVWGCPSSAPNSNEQRRYTYTMKVARPEKPLGVAPITATLSLVDIVPLANSGETNQDSEPNLTVNPLNPSQIVASAFTPGPFDTQENFCPRTLSPIYVSNDAGASWGLNCIVPTYPSTFDITVRFGPSSGNLYAGILSNNSSKMIVLRTPNPLDTVPMQQLLQRDSFDQPYIEVARSGGLETLYVGENNCCSVPVAGGKSANIDTSFNPATSSPRFTRAVIESRDTFGFDLASVRVAAHQSDDTIYGVFMGVPSLASDQATTLASVVVVRDDHGGNGNKPYVDLKDPTDRLPGRLVANNLRMPPGPLGQQRLTSQSHVSIAVDPRPMSDYAVYVAWVDQGSTGSCTLHVQRSNNQGKTWSQDLRQIQDATNPALAVNADGVAAFLYQQLASDHTWETHLEISADQFETMQPFVLSKTPDASPVLQFEPYLGDYTHLLAVGRTFYGIFSANNTPDRNNFPFLQTFPSGLIYQREADFNTHTLSDKQNNVASVPPSIDPFFLEVTLSSPPNQ